MLPPQDRYNVLAEQLATDPAGLEAGDRQQLERLAATLHRLAHSGGEGRLSCMGCMYVFVTSLVLM